MKIIISQASSAHNGAEAIVKAAEASDKLPLGAVAESHAVQTGRAQLTFGAIKWMDGEHGEEDALRRACHALTHYAKKNAVKNIVIDTASFSKYYLVASYVINILLEEFTAISSAEALDNLTISLLMPTCERGEDLNEELQEALSKPFLENVKLSYGDYGDPLEEEFLQFEKSLRHEKTFPEYLFMLMRKKGIDKNSELYKAAGVSKYTFSRLANQAKPPHKPSKETVAALAIGFKLQIDEAEEFYNVAGYSLSKTEFVDKVVRFFINKRIYDIDEVNYCLDYYGYPILGERARGEK